LVGRGVGVRGPRPHPPTPNPKSPIPNPQSPIELYVIYFCLKFLIFKLIKNNKQKTKIKIYYY